MSGYNLTINEAELWVLINHHLENEGRDVQKRNYADASDEKARAEYLRSLLPTKS